MAAMDGKTVVITGASAGLGEQTARVLAGMGAHIVMVCRNPTKSEPVAAAIRAGTNAPVDLVIGDLASLESVRGIAATILERYPRIDVLLSNAGVFRVGRSETVDGIEETFAVNHLAPFLITNMLLDRLRENPGSRIVITASDAHHSARLRIDDLQLERRYGSWRAYSNSKLCNVLFTYALARRLEGSGVTVNALHPGFVRTSLGSGNHIPVRPVYWLLRPFTISVERGAETSVHLASSPEVKDVNGAYFSSSAETLSSRVSYDEDLQEQLWDQSARLAGI